MAQNHSSILVILAQVAQDECKLLQHPQKHLGSVSLARRVKHVSGGSSRVYVRCVEVTYILGGQPSPSGFLGHIIGHAEVLSVYLEEEG